MELKIHGRDMNAHYQGELFACLVYGCTPGIIDALRFFKYLRRAES